MAAISAFATVVVIRLTGNWLTNSVRKTFAFGNAVLFFGWLGTLFADASVKVFLLILIKMFPKDF